MAILDDWWTTRRLLLATFGVYYLLYPYLCSFATQTVHQRSDNLSAFELIYSTTD